MTDPVWHRHRLSAIGLALAVLTIGVYWPAINSDFVDWDDGVYVSENPFVANGLTPASLYYALTTFDSGNWIPATWLSYELDAALFGINSTAFHAVNLVWHAANVWLLFYVLYRYTTALGRSTIVAALFAVHPLHVESVAWISERKDLLSTFALLLALLAYRNYAARPTRRSYLIVVILVALGLMAKPMLVSTPILLLLIDVWPLRRLAGWPPGDETGKSSFPTRTAVELCLEKVPLLVLSAVDGVVTIIAQSSSDAVARLDEASFWARCGNAIYAYGWYLWKTFCPLGLCANYLHPLSALTWSSVSLSAGVLLAISLWVAWRRAGHLLFGWGWFLISLLPVIGLLQVGVQAYADRYAYIPHIGLLTLIVWEIAHWIQRIPGDHALAKTRFAAVLVTLALAGCAWLTRIQVSSWRTTETLWGRALAVDPDNVAVLYVLGQYHFKHSHFEEAAKQFSSMLEVRSNNLEAIKYLGRIHELQGDRESAATFYEWALRLNSQDHALRKHFTTLPARWSRKVTSREFPDPTAAAEVRLGVDAAKRGDLMTGLKHFEAALLSDPDDVVAHLYSASILEQRGRIAEAEHHFQAALRVSPHDPEARYGLAGLRRRNP